MRPAIALHRPGAIGDVLMTLHLVPWLRRKWLGHAVHYVCHPAIGEGLYPLMRAAGVDQIRPFDSRYRDGPAYAAWYDLIGYPLAEGYPERPMSKHLLDYFAAEVGVDLPAGDDRYLTLPLPERPANAPKTAYATLQVKAGWSVYKEWSLAHWAAVVAACDFPVVQLGQEGDPAVPGATLATGTIADMAALLAHARIHLGIDSYSNHLTAYRWRAPGGAVHSTPGVILWGSTQYTAAGYPHNVNLSLGLPCQPCFRENPAISRMPRGACINPPGQVYERPRHACMNGISVEAVTAAVASQVGATRQGEVAPRYSSPLHSRHSVH